jgi:hypothetical protein
MRSAWVPWICVLGVAACAEPVIELSLRLPDTDEGGDFNTSCAAAIEVFATGKNYPEDPNDFRRDCIQISDQPTFRDIKDAMAGKFELQIPDSGLASVEIYGRTGDCNTPDDLLPQDLVFFGAAKYAGGEALSIKLTGNLSCTKQEVTIRPVDMMALIATKDCAMAKLADTLEAGAETGTLSPHLTNETCWSGGYESYSSLTNGIATFMSYTTVGPETCLGVSGYNETMDSYSCVIPGPSACALANEIEVAALPYELADRSLDSSLMSTWHGALFGAVWANTPAKGPVAGARVTVDPELGQVVYVEPNAAGSQLVPTGASATGPSGMFMLYTSKMVDVTVEDRSARRRTMKLTAIDFAPSTALVVLP